MKITKTQKNIRFKILDKIYSKGPISRIDISKETNITPATVSEITGEMINQKLIHEIGEAIPQQGKSGRKKILLDISPNHSFYIGSELSQKYISFCLTDNTGKIIKEKSFVLSHYDLNNTLSEHFYINKLQEFIESCTEYNPKGIGIAIPGHFHDENKSIITNNAFWKNFNIKTLIDNIQLPIFFENNVKCMTLAERLLFNNGNDDNFIFFHVGRGMFCSYMYNGELYAKNNYLVGEIGHIVVHPDGELCECGKRGCLQTYASEAWIIKKAQIIFDNSESTYLKQLISEKDKITIDTILKAYLLGDEGIIHILHSAIKYLAITLNNLSMMIDSNKIIIHGELFKEPLLSNLLKEYLDKELNLLGLQNNKNVIIKNYYNYTGALAASTLCINELLVK
ncbi:ROK family transcriptional regulator [Clostridium sp.]|uniref:ROK family transcriptional regulator n=1 Tax=Clostridium sp. TaxID=1506 RepID=UPI001D1B6C5F|nr:ROK family transcriptional regulator [Clostridium sp.]MBS5985299.1 ROK family protein [Clostridium sp.]